MARYTETTPAESDIHNDGYRCSYCPEDDKLRLYTGRVERQTYEALVAAGYKATPKQSCSFVATWSIKAEDMAFLLIPEDADIEDEDISPEERAADRAERFAGYRDKRRAEAGGFADRFEAGPDAHGYQNAARAERAAARHDRQRDKALCQWSKAEYWQTRTAGVIAHALHRSDAATRRGRILEIEKEIRRIENEYTPCFRRLVRPGGAIVSLCYAGPRQRAAFENRDGWTWELLPAGSFKAEGTMADVAMIWKRKAE